MANLMSYKPSFQTYLQLCEFLEEMLVSYFEVLNPINLNEGSGMLCTKQRTITRAF